MKTLRDNKSPVQPEPTDAERQGLEVSAKTSLDFEFNQGGQALANREKKKIYDTPRCFQRN